MKKITKFFSAMVVLLATIGMTVNAQTYFTDYGNMTKTSGRKLNAVNFTKTNGGEAIGTVTVGQTTATGVPVYFDKTAQKIYVKPGTAVSINFDWTGAWMHNIAFVDWDNNKTFGETLDASNKEYLGKNNAGGGAQVAQPINFTVDAAQTLGEYRMRLIIDWIEGNPTTFPGANQSIGESLNSNGGSVTDLTLVITKSPELLNAIATAQSKYDTALPEGDAIGQYSTTLRNTLQTNITQATAVANNSNATEEEISTALSNLQAAIDALIINKPQSSTAENPKWYYIIATPTNTGTNINSRDYARGKVISSNTPAGGAEGMLSWEDKTNSDAQLWRFEGDETTGYKIINKTASKGILGGNEYAALANDEGVNYDINHIANTTHFIIIEKGGNAGKALHANADQKIARWTSNDPDGNSSWTFELYTDEAKKNLFKQKRTDARTLYTNTASLEGDKFGQYPTINRTTFDSSITTAEGKSDTDIDAMTSAELDAAIVDIDNAISAYLNARNTNTSTLVSNDNTKLDLYTIKNNSSSFTDAYDKVISTNGKNTGERFALEVADNTSDKQLFAFEAGTNNNAVSNILQNIANTPAVYMNKSAQLSGDGLATGDNFVIESTPDGISFTIVPQTDNVETEQPIKGNTDDIGVQGRGTTTARDWTITYVKTIKKPNNNSVSNTPLSSLAITVSNGIINVAGADSFEVYSIAGQRINTTQPLLKGIYIVKTATTTQKVLVK